MRYATLCAVWFVILSLLVTTAIAADVVPDREDQKVLSSRAFLDAHPDMKYRTEGWFAYQEGRFEEARDHFLHAARFGDKLSQAMLAEMVWKGQGVPADRVAGYAWADVAAERGYVQFIALREGYWKELSTEERERVVVTGRPLLLEYGDEAARPRMSKHLRLARRYMISYRPRKDVTVIVPGRNGQPIQIRGHDFYADKFWDAKKYQAWVDAIWSDPPEGEVDVGEPETVGRER